MIKIVSYNVNGIRAALRKGLAGWIAVNDPDIVCIQEVKANADQVDTKTFTDLGYHLYWHSATKKGYSGVLTMSKQPADFVQIGCGLEHYDTEGRILRTDFGDLTILNCYFPSGTTGDIRQAFKIKFLADFQKFTANLQVQRPQLIVLGDYNIAHNEIDIHDPVRNKKTSGFLPEERAWMSSWLDSGYTDAYRHLNPDGAEYSWWSYRANARNNNKGWRIDYIAVSDPLKKRLLKAYHDKDAVHSDHCPIVVEMKQEN